MKKEELLKFYQTYKTYIFLFVTALSSLILIIFGIYPQISKLLSNNQVEKDISQRSKFLEAKAATLEGYSEEDLSSKVRDALNAYPVDKELISAVTILQNLVGQAGFNVVSLTIGAAAPSSGSGSAQSYSIKIDLFGLADALPSLLNNIENSPRIMRVSSIESNAGGSAAGSTISLRVEVLFAAAPSGFGSVDSPLPELSEKEQETLAKLATVTTTKVSVPEIPTQLPARGRENPFQ